MNETVAEAAGKLTQSQEGMTNPAPAIRTLPKGRSLWADAWKRMKRDRLAMLCLAVVVLYAVVALLVAFGLIATTWGTTYVTEYQAPSTEKWQLWFGAGRHLCLGGPLARAELSAIVRLLVGDGRPFRVVSRRYGRRVLIPAYAELVV